MGAVTAGVDAGAGAAMVAAGRPVAAAEGVVVACGVAIGSTVGLVAVDNVPQAMPSDNSTTASNQKCLMLPPARLIHRMSTSTELIRLSERRTARGPPREFHSSNLSVLRAHIDVNLVRN